MPNDSSAATRRIVMIADMSGAHDYHVGDEAMLEANVDSLRKLLPGVSFTLVSRDPAWSSNYFSEPAIPYLGFRNVKGYAYQEAGTREDRERLFADVMQSLQGFVGGAALDEDAPGRPSIEAVAQCDAVFISGGGNLSPGSINHIYERAALMKIAYALHKPVIVTGQQLDPVLDDESHRLLAATLPEADLVGVRDRTTEEMAREMGVSPDRLVYQIDDAFFMPRPDEGSQVYELADSLCSPWIAVNMPGLKVGTKRFDQYARELRAIADRTGAQLVFIPHHDYVGEEATLYSELVSRLDVEGAHRVVSTFLNSREAAWLTQQADMVFGWRYHHMIFGLSNNVPSLAVITDFPIIRAKYLSALRHAGLTSWAVEDRYALSGGLSRAAIDLWSKRKDVRGHLESQQTRWRASYNQRWERIVAVLDGTVTHALQKTSSTGMTQDSQEEFSPSWLWTNHMRLFMLAYRTLKGDLWKRRNP